jgi:chromosome segregation ATPase
MAASESSDSDFSHEILDRFNKFVKSKKATQGNSPKATFSRAVTRQYDEQQLISNLELTERIQHLEAKLQRRDLTIANFRREAAVAMLQTVDQTRIDGGTIRVVDRVLENANKINQCEDEILVLKRDQEEKMSEIAALKKQLLMSGIKFQNRVTSLENETFELQEKLRICIAENKQKTVYLSGKDNLLEQLNEMLRKRDEKFLEAEEKYASLMVQHENAEQENLNLTSTLFELNNQLDALRESHRDQSERFSILVLDKQQIQSTLNIWKQEYLGLTER